MVFETTAAVAEIGGASTDDRLVDGCADEAPPLVPVTDAPMEDAPLSSVVEEGLTSAPVDEEAEVGIPLTLRPGSGMNTRDDELATTGLLH
jgi:hypothetical protein